MKKAAIHYLYGYYPIIEALQAGKRKFHQLFLEKTTKIIGKQEDILELASQKNIPIHYKTSLELEKFCGHSNHQHCVLKSGEIVYQSLDMLLEKKKKKNIWVGLDRVQDPQNLGAILRTCLYFQIDNIFLTKQQTCPLSTSVSRASTGAMEKLIFCSPMNFTLLIKRLKKENFWVAGASLDGQDFTKHKPPENCFLILGNENKGIQPLLQKYCDFLWKIQGGGTNSLNVSASSAILLHYLYSHKK